MPNRSLACTWFPSANVSVSRIANRDFVDPVDQVAVQLTIASVQPTPDIPGDLVKLQGNTRDSLKKRLKGSLAWQKYQQEKLSDANIQQFFQQNQDQFQGDLKTNRSSAISAMVGQLWEEIVQQMRPRAEIKVPQGANSGNGAPGRPDQPGQPRQPGNSSGNPGGSQGGTLPSQP